MLSRKKRKIEIVRVVDVQKRRSPSKHYVYLMDVQWSDGSICLIGRRFSAFFDMHIRLLEMFPDEAGQKDPSKRIIPYLPGRSLLQLTSTRDASLKKLGSITEYCEAITNLPSHLLQGDIVQNFFETNLTDLENNSSKKKTNDTGDSVAIKSITGPMEFESYVAIAEYVADTKAQLHLRVGEFVEVVEKNENGWWLVCNGYGLNGWAPGAYLEKPNGDREDLITIRADPGKGMWYTATNTYEASSQDEISFPIGAALEVLQKNLEGWWLARFNGNEGWVPGSYLKESESSYNMRNANIQNEEVKKPPPKRSTIRRQLNPSQIRSRNEKPSAEVQVASFITLFPFESNIADGINFVAGEKVKVIEEADNGWWYVSINDRTGWAPAGCLVMDSSNNLSNTLRVSTPVENISSSSSNLLSKIKETASLNENGNTFDNSNDHKRLQGDGNNYNRPPLPTPSNKTSSAIQSPRKSPSTPRKSFPLPAPPRIATTINNFEISSASQMKLSSMPRNFKFYENEPGEEEQDAVLRKSSLPKFSQDNRHSPIEDEKWFKDISRQSAEAALYSEDKEGYFIVRRSNTGGPQIPYSLTLYHRRTIFNFHIRQREIDKRFATGVYTEGEKTFDSIREMVEFYRYNKLVVGNHSNQVNLIGTPENVF